ncbi:hypothetical protein D3C87_1995690 [compost metagenome]
MIPQLTPMDAAALTAIPAAHHRSARMSVGTPATLASLVRITAMTAVESRTRNRSVPLKPPPVVMTSILVDRTIAANGPTIHGLM